MTLTAREAMQALLDGKTLERDSPWYQIKLDDEGKVVACDSRYLLEKGIGFADCHTLISDMDRIVGEYPLTFGEALRAMLDGRVVEPDYDGGLHHRFNKDHGCLEFYSKAEGAWNRCGLDVSEQEAKWRAVG